MDQSSPDSNKSQEGVATDTAATAATTATGQGLRCSFQATDGPDSTSTSTSTDSDDRATTTGSAARDCLWFGPNQGKRSSFLLDLSSSHSRNNNRTPTPPAYHVIPGSPCHCYVEYVSHPTNNTDHGYFFLGGFQLISTARFVEVYVTRQGHHQKEELLMTCRGIPVRDTATTSNNTTSNNTGLQDDCFKVFSVVPGGPRPITQLHLKLVAASPTTTTTATSSDTDPDPNTTGTKLVSIQLTGRLPDSSPPQPVHSPAPSKSNPLSSSGIGTPSSAQMMQQMMQQVAVSRGMNSGLFTAPTPLASGSNPLRSPPPQQHPAAGVPVTSPFSFPASPTGHSTTTFPTPPTRNHNTTNSTSETILAGVSFLVRSEGQHTVEQVRAALHRSETAHQDQLDKIHTMLQQQQNTIHTLLQQQQQLIQQQAETTALLQQQQQQQQQMMMMTMMMNRSPPTTSIPAGPPQQHSEDGIVPDSESPGDIPSPSRPPCGTVIHDDDDDDDADDVHDDDGDGIEGNEKPKREAHRTEKEQADAPNHDDDDDEDDDDDDRSNDEASSPSGSGEHHDADNHEGDGSGGTNPKGRDDPGNNHDNDNGNDHTGPSEENSNNKQQQSGTKEDSSSGDHDNNNNNNNNKEEEADDSTAMVTLSEMNTESYESQHHSDIMDLHHDYDVTTDDNSKTMDRHVVHDETQLIEHDDDGYNFLKLARSSEHAVVWENKERCRSTHRNNTGNSPPLCVMEQRMDSMEADHHHRWSIQCSPSGVEAVARVPASPAGGDTSLTIHRDDSSDVPF